MKYYIGIDAGGTKSKCVLADENLKVLSEYIEGSGNFLTQGIDTVVERFHNAIVHCLNEQNLQYTEINSIVIGCTGAGTSANGEKLRTEFIKYSLSKGINYSNVIVTSDAIIALEAAFSGKPGAILIAGTGSVLFGKDEENQIHRIGGAGKIIGDEGSGYLIGTKAINAVFKYFDGRGLATSITDVLNNEFDVKDIDTLIGKFYNEKICPSKLAPYVINEAEKEDEIAIHILEEQALELVKHVQVIQKKIPGKLKLSLMGGLFGNHFYSSLVKKLINILAPNTTIIEPENPPETGALILAKTAGKKNGYEK